MRDFRSNLAELASCHDVFTCFVGEADMSYDFSYYKGGSDLQDRKVAVLLHRPAILQGW